MSADADVVFGSRLTHSKITKIVGFPNYIGNKIFTTLANFLFNRIFTDIATGYKVFKKEIIKNMEIHSNGFEIEPEITAKIAKIVPKLNIYEVGISYRGRTYEEGKKIGLKDGLRAFYCLLKYKYFIN